MNRSIYIAVSMVLAVCASSGNAADLTLTPTGVSSGFTLSTFATIVPGATTGTGPMGVAVASNGNVLVQNTSNITLYTFADTDGQTTSTAVNTVIGFGGGLTAFATAGGQAYGGYLGSFAQFNPDGSVNHTLTGVTYNANMGVWGNPVNGHIIASTAQGALIDIDPNANGGNGSASVIAANPGSVDGVSVSPDGTTAYVAATDHIVGYNIANGAQVFDSGTLASGPDGVAVIASHDSLNGHLIINFNGVNDTNGFVGLLDPTTDALTVIASGGARGDYVASDTNNGTLFLDYSDNVYRLSCGPDCAIGQPLATVPVPTAAWLFGSGLLGLVGVARRGKTA